MKFARVIDASDRQTWITKAPGSGYRRVEGDPLSGSAAPTDEPVEVKQWLAPTDPPAILCIGLNYRKHAEEGGLPVPQEPIFFMKNPSAMIGHGELIRIPKVCQDEVDYECELAVIIGKGCLDRSSADALASVAGYSCANDVSARIWQLQRGGSQWNRGKSFDTFCPIGPFIVTPDQILDPNTLGLKTVLNGLTVQESNTADMIFNVPALISFLSQDTTLRPGTVILTGTPEGIGWARKPRLTLQPGDEVTVEIEKIGRLTNRVTGNR